MQEIWKAIEDHIGYEVSNMGNVRSYRSRNGRGCLKTVPRLLKVLPTPKKEYLRVGLPCSDGRVQWFPVHKLVLLAFEGLPPSVLHECCHHDGNAKNNRITNLRWGTRQSNADDRIRHGTQIRGTSVGISVLTEDQVREVKAAIPFWVKGMGRAFAIKFGVGDACISQIKRGNTWGHVC